VPGAVGSRDSPGPWRRETTPTVRDYSHYNPGTAAAFERSDAAARAGDPGEAAREFIRGLAIASPEEQRRILAAAHPDTAH
jgi:hypothetical protein